jgi:excisionase family DNA binding protein
MSPRKAAPPAEVDETKIMTLRQVAEYLACSRTLIYRMAVNGKIPAFRLGADWRFRRSDIEQWISNRRVGPGARRRDGRGGSRPEAGR